MAIVKGPFQLSGSVSNVTFYTRRGSNEVILRTKGGVKGDKMKRLKQFDGFRQQQKEWSGVTKCAAGVRMAFGGLHRLADYNLTPALNSLCNKMQKCDNSNDKGRRTVLLSTGRQALTGFNFNRTYPFNSVLRVSVESVLDRESLSASVSFPPIQTDIDVLNIQHLPYFRVLIALGTASDMKFDERLNDYIPETAALHGAAAVAESVWYAANSRVEAQTLRVQLSQKQQTLLTESVSVVLSVAIEFGAIGFDGKPTAVKYAGSGKVLKTE